MSAPDPYRPPEAQLTGAPGGETDPLRAFVDRNADYYLQRWEPLRRGESSLAGFNWAAAFLNTYWMFYRKLYAWGIALTGLGVLVGGSLGASIEAAGESEELIVGIGGLMLLYGVAQFVVVGFAGNVLLYRRAVRVGEEAVPPWHLSDMARHGGTSVLGVGLAFLVLVVLQMALALMVGV